MSHACKDAPGQPRAILVATGYAAGNLGKNILWTSFESFLLFYLVSVRGFPAWLAGSVLAAALVWDGLADMGVGYLADRFARPHSLSWLIVAGAPLAAVGFWFTFAAPAGQPEGSIILAYLLCRVGYTLCDIGHNTLLVRVAVTSRQATLVSGLRLIFSAIGSGLVGLAAVHLLARPPGDPMIDTFGRFAGLAGVIYCVTLLGSVLATWHLPAPPRPSGPGPNRALWRAVLGNRPYLTVLAIIALQAALLPSFNRSLLFFAQAMDLPRTWPGYALTTIAVSQSLSLPLWMALAKRLSAEAILLRSHGLAISAMMLVAWTVGGPAGWPVLIVYGIGQGGMNMAVWALLSTSIRNAPGASQASEALPVGLFLATLKCAAALGNGLLAWSIADGSALVPDRAGGAVIVFALGLPVLGSCAIIAICVLAQGARQNPDPV